MTKLVVKDCVFFLKPFKSEYSHMLNKKSLTVFALILKITFITVNVDEKKIIKPNFLKHALNNKAETNTGNLMFSGI